MMQSIWRKLPMAGLVALFALPSMTQTSGNSFVNFEASLTNPVRLSTDGTRLYCVNNPNGTLSVFSLASPTAPSLIAEIPVGIEPVSVNPRTDDEVWVVNQESDSISVVSVSKGIVTDTIQAKDEPSDVVFAGIYAFVSIARSNLINVYSVTPAHTLVQSIPVYGDGPRAMAVSANGATVYAAFAIAGNQTTGIPLTIAPPPPPPTNPALPPAPQQGIIVPATDAAWKSYITWTQPTNGVVAINTSTLAVSKYYSLVGTINLGIAVQPSTGNIFVANSQAQNTIRFQGPLCGLFFQNRISKINAATGTVVAYSLDPVPPGKNYCAVDDAGLAVSLAQPANLVFDSTGNYIYLAAFGTDRIAKLDTAGHILNEIELNPQAIGPAVNSATKRGPRGEAILYAARTLYVHNRISNTLSVINTANNSVVEEIPTGSHDPTPAAITQGRGFLYDAKLSGVGNVSCASCHVDAEGDHLAWDLGNPDGTMFPIVEQGGATYELHPMKGPLTTLTLRGLANTEPYHWRGDKPVFSDFNVAFQELMGGNQLSTDQMTAFTNFINTVTFMPNPYQNLDRSYPASLPSNAPSSLIGGSPAAGYQKFQTEIINQIDTCNNCHTSANYDGSNFQIVLLGGGKDPSENQPLKNTLLRATYQKMLFTKRAAGNQSIDGFGITHDGTEDTLVNFLKFTFGGLNGKPQDVLDIGAYNVAFDTGTAPAVGFAHTLDSATIANPQINSDWTTLERQATVQNCDLIAEGTVRGVVSELLYQPAQANYLSTTGATYTHNQILALVSGSDTLTVMGVPYGSGSRYAFTSRVSPLLRNRLGE